MAPLDADPLGQPVPRFAVRRPALERRLDQIAPGGAGLVVASAGSGKSVLVRQWAASRGELRIAALGLGERHDDAVVLARELLSAIRTVEPALGGDLIDVVMAGGSALGPGFVEGLASALGNLEGDLVLVLEDAHLVTNRAVLNDLGELVARLPRTARAIVTTRWDPPWTVRQMRLDGRLVEIRGKDLAFGVEEARQLLAAVSERDLTDAQVRLLVDRTDGWVVGLQLAAISLQRVEDVGESVESFAGTDRLVADYLLEEVVEQQPPAVRRFLLRTSVLDWFSIELCDAVTGDGNARAMLDEVAERSLFLVSLDRSGERFRYHHLFAELLRYRLRNEDASAAATLHATAAQWLMDHGHTEAAIGHLLAAGQRREAFEIISDVGHLWFERGESATLVRWLTTIAGPGLDVPVAVTVSLIAAHVAADETAAAAELHRRLTKRVDLSLGARAAADALFACLVFRDLAPEESLKTAAGVLDALPLIEPGDIVDFLGIGGTESIEVMAEYAAAVAHFLQGDLAETAAGLERVLALPGVDYPMWRIYTLGTLALVRAWAGHGTEALQLADAAIDTARAFGVSHHQAVTHAHMAAGLVHLDRADTERAVASLAESAAQNERRTSSVTFFDLQRLLEARLAALTEGSRRALSILREPAACAVEPVVLDRANRTLEAHLRIRADQLVEARALLNGDERIAELASAHVDLALACGDLTGARAELDRWEPGASDVRAAVEHLIRTGVVLDAEGDHEGARAAVTEAVARAQPDQLRWPFLEVPAALRMLRRGPHPGARFLDDVLRGAVSSLDARSAAQRGLVEQLTDRELAVLKYLPGRMRNQEIAGALYVSINTLKTHLRNLYRKLDVTDRDEAVKRAGDLGFL